MVCDRHGKERAYASLCVGPPWAGAEVTHQHLIFPPQPLSLLWQAVAAGGRRRPNSARLCNPTMHAGRLDGRREMVVVHPLAFTCATGTGPAGW